MIKSDDQGFLIGNPVEIDRSMQIWQEIKDEMRLIRMAITGENGLKGISAPIKKSISDSSKQISRAVSQSALSSAKKIATPPPKRTASTLSSTEKAKIESNISSRIKSQQIATPSRLDRDSKGRFMAGKAKTGGGSGFPPENDRLPNSSGRDRIIDSSSDEGEKRLLGSIAEKVVNVVNEATSGSEEIDPSIKAMNEIAQPVARGYEMLTQGNGGRVQKRTEQWFKRIFGEIKLFRKEETVFNKAANKSLKNIEEKPSESGGGSSLLSLFLVPLGVLATSLILLAKRIPGIGALFTSAGNIIDMLKGGDKSKAVGGITGTLAGMYGGAKAGAMAGSFAGPIGVAIGSVVGGVAGMFFGNEAGQIIGGKIGEWTDQLKQADIPGKINNAWTSFTESLSSKISAGWDAVTNLIKEKFGIDIKEKVSKGIERIKQSPAGRVISKVKDTVDSALDGASDMIKRKGSEITGSAAKNKEALVRQMKHAGITDPTEQAMFMAQMDHESAGFTRMEESFKYRSAERLMSVSKSARNKGKEAIERALAQGPEAVAELMYGGRMGNTSPGDGFKFRGRGHIQLTGRDNYAAAGKALGIDLLNMPDLAAKPEIAGKIAAWYWKQNNLGGMAIEGNVDGVTKRINGGLNGIDHRRQLFSQYQGHFGMPLVKDMGSSLTSVNGKLSLPTHVSMGSTVTSHTNIPIAPKAPQPQKIADAPAIPEPLTSKGINSDRKPSVVALAGDVGQDVKDRGIAHIVTGGLSD
jgi:putative chitinase